MIDPDLVKQIANTIPEVRGCHRVRSRGVAAAAQLDLHLLLDPELPLHHAHKISHIVETRLRKEIPTIVDVTIHIEPEDDDDDDL